MTLSQIVAHDFATLIETAYGAPYKAKAAGGGRWVFAGREPHPAISAGRDSAASQCWTRAVRIRPRY